VAHTCFEEGYPRYRGTHGRRFSGRIHHVVDSSKSGANARLRANRPIAPDTMGEKTKRRVALRCERRHKCRFAPVSYAAERPLPRDCLARSTR
jgi:hypothetical protein